MGYEKMCGNCGRTKNQSMMACPECRGMFLDYSLLDSLSDKNKKATNSLMKAMKKGDITRII